MSGMSSVHLTGLPRYRLTPAWRAYLALVNIPTARVDALAAVGDAVEGFLLLQALQADAGTAASQHMRPTTPPFEVAPQPGLSGAAALPHSLRRGEATGAQALSAGNAAPIAGAAAGQGARPQRAQLFVRSVRFRPLVPSRGFREAPLHQRRVAATRCTAAIFLGCLTSGGFQ